MGPKPSSSRRACDIPQSAAEAVEAACSFGTTPQSRLTLINLRRALGVDEMAEPGWAQLLAAIRDIPEILETIPYDITIPRDGVRPAEMAITADSLLQKLRAQRHESAAAGHAILRLVEVGCLEAKQVAVPIAVTKELGQLLLRALRKRHKTAKGPVGDVYWPISCVVPTHLLAGWQKLVEPPQLEEWPPHKGWAFQPGEAAYNGTRFEIRGKERQVLERFVRASGVALTISELRTDVWDGYVVEDSTIRSTVSKLRNIIRNALGLSKSKTNNPLPSAGEQAYKLILK